MESESIGLTIRHATQRHAQICAGERAAAGGHSEESRGAEPVAQGSGGAAKWGAIRWRPGAAWASRLRSLLRWSGRTRRLESECAALRGQLDSLEARVRRMEDRERPRVPSAGEMGLNLTSKATALKLSRSGQDARQIARALGVPAGEIELLLKVQALQAEFPAALRRREPEREKPSGGAPGDGFSGGGPVAVKPVAVNEDWRPQLVN